jgi:hypothetical protein
MSNLVNFARKELELAGYFDKDAMYGGMLGDAVIKMIEQFADEGHSGMSANITISLFQRLAHFEPLTPLTGENDEWNDISDDSFTAFAITEPDEETNDIISAINSSKPCKKLWQNKRCSHVFKDEDGAYDSEGRIFREPSGACFTSKDSRVPVTFPYTPKREYIDVNGDR